MLTLVASYSGILGGAERLLLDMTPALPGERCLACPDGPLADAARAAGMRVLPLRERPLELRSAPARAVRDLGAHAAELRGLLGSLRPELVIGWGMRSAVACAVAVRGSERAPRLVFQHNDFLPSPLVGRLVRAATRRADRVVALSEAVARDLDPRFGEHGRTRVAHPGVDVGRFPPSPPPAGAPEVAVLGAIVDWKRPELALEAVAGALGAVPELRLTIAGAPLDGRGRELLGRLEARAALPDLAGRVELAGPVAEPRELLRRASCLLHCAEHEPFGLVVIEALASARPVVAPAAGGPAEVVDDEVGRLYEPGDARAASAALVDVLADPGRAAALGAAGRQRVERRFGMDAARARWLAAVEPPVEAAAESAGAGLALVVVTHESEAHLRALLASTARHLPAAHVVVADSGSRDRSVELARGFPGATVLELGANVGFGTACNRALGAVGEPAVALLNPDVELLDPSLGLLAREVERTDRPERILAPLVLLPDGTRQDSVHPPPLSTPDLVRALVPPGALPARVALPLAPWRAERPRRVGWAVGCCIVARTETLRRLGPFDERIFLYAEDLDLGLTAAERGIETWFWPDARVLHHRAHASERAFGGEPFELLARQRRQVIEAHRGRRGARLDDAAQLTTFAGRMALKRLLGRDAQRERRQLAALRRARRRPSEPAPRP